MNVAEIRDAVLDAWRSGHDSLTIAEAMRPAFPKWPTDRIERVVLNIIHADQDRRYAVRQLRMAS